MTEVGRPATGAPQFDQIDPIDHTEHVNLDRNMPEKDMSGPEMTAPGVVSVASRTRSKSAGQGVGEWVGILVAAIIAAFLLKTFVVQTFWIPSASMEHTLNINDRVLVNKLSYDIGSVHRGDVVVFKRPPAETNVTIEDLIKRVIALPGDSIEARSGIVYVNGKPIDEPYLNLGTVTINLPVMTVPDHHLFVMGDNRGDSSDSRVFGPIDESLLVGKAELRIWPFPRFGTL